MAGTCFHRAGALGECVWPGWHLVLLLSGLSCVYGLAGTWFFCYRACLVSTAWLALGSSAIGLALCLLPGWHLVPSRWGFGQIRWCVTGLFSHFLPSPEAFPKPRWNEKSCSSTFFHRPEVYVKGDGMKKASVLRFIHRRRAFLNLDG